MSQSRVAVVITAWNAERFLAEALRSVFEQTEPPSSIVVVDDGSTDATASLAESFGPGVTVLRCAHRGVGASRNEGIAATDEEYVALLDADDLWMPTKLERQRELFDDDPSLGAAFCLVDEFVDMTHDTTGTRLPQLAQRAPMASGCLAPRATIERIGPFMTSTVGDWLDWWSRARVLAVREGYVPEVLVRRRIHGANNSAVNSDGGATFLRAAREHLVRARSRPQDPGPSPEGRG